MPDPPVSLPVPLEMCLTIYSGCVCLSMLQPPGLNANIWPLFWLCTSRLLIPAYASQQECVPPTVFSVLFVYALQV